jgi:hypothetical protein
MVQVGLRCLAALCLAFGGVGPAFASDGSNSDSGNSSDSGSSSDSGNSSDSKSSEDSDGSSERSSENSTRGTTEESTQGTKDSTKSDSGKTISIGGAILLLGGTVIGGIALTAASDDDDERVAEVKLERFLRRHHSGIARDVVLAEGPVLSALTSELGLSRVEKQRFAVALEGSAEQTELLESLAGDLGSAKVRAFAEKMCSVATRALGAERIKLAAAGAARG